VPGLLASQGDGMTREEIMAEIEKLKIHSKPEWKKLLADISDEWFDKVWNVGRKSMEKSHG
jgi:hypothetical protein